MEVFETLKNRRSIAKVLQNEIPREKIEKIIEAGCWAPTHRRTDPWRFVVFEGYGRQKLQEAIFEGVQEVNQDLPADELQEKCIKFAGKVSRAPVIIAVWAAVGRGKKNPPIWEDISAVSACCQNMLLAAEELKLGAIWRTGSFVDLPPVQRLMVSQNDRFDAAQGDKIVAFIYLGEVDEEYSRPKRETPEYKSKTTFCSS